MHYSVLINRYCFRNERILIACVLMLCVCWLLIFDMKSDWTATLAIFDEKVWVSDFQFHFNDKLLIV